MGSSDESDSDDGFDSCSDGGFEDARSALSDPPSWSGRGVDNDGSDEGSEDGFESPEEFEDARSVLSDLSSMSLNTHATAGTLPDADDLGLDDEDRLASSSEKSASGTRATADSDDRRGWKDTNLDAGAAAGRLNADRAARKTRERRERLVRLELERDVSARDVVPSDRALFLEEGHEGADGVDGRADRRADGSRAHVRHVRRYTAPPKAPATTLDDEGLRKERAANGVPARKPIASSSSSSDDDEDPWSRTIRQNDEARIAGPTLQPTGRRLSRDGSFEWRHHREFQPLPTVDSRLSLLNSGESGSSVDTETIQRTPENSRELQRPGTSGGVRRHPATNLSGGRPRHRASGGAGPDNDRSRSLRSDPSSASYPVHAAAYYGDVDALRTALHDARAADRKDGIDGTHERSALRRLDPCGNSALHVAVTRRSRSALATMLEDEYDFPLDARSSAGWTPLQEAVHMGSRTMCRQLFVKTMDRSKRQFERKKPKLLATLASLPDFRMKIHWEFGSMVFGPIVRAYAPQDTYEITKRGTQLRIDGTLKGMEDPDENGGGILPKWRRGKFSLVFEGKDGDSRLLFLDHVKRECVDVGNEPEETSAEERDRIDNEVDVMMEEGPTKRKYRADDVVFKPVKAWLGGTKREKVGEWSTEVYEASGKMAKRKVTRNGAYKVNGTFSEYLASFKEGAADIVVDRRVNDFQEAESEEEDEDDVPGGTQVNARKPTAPSPDTRPTSAVPGSRDRRERGAPVRVGPTDSNREPPPPLTAKQKWKAERARKKREGKDEKPRRVTARCWLAHEFPMTVDDMLPILDVMSHANKHLNKANRLIQYWRADHGGAFPVKVTVPIAMTVYVVMRFKDFARLPATDDGMSGLPTDHFEVPRGFVLKSLDQALKEAEEEEAAKAKARAERERVRRKGKKPSSKSKGDGTLDNSSD